MKYLLYFQPTVTSNTNPMHTNWHTVASIALGIFLVAAPIFIIYFGFFTVVFLIFWAMLYALFLYLENVKWYFKLIVPILAYYNLVTVLN